jgi:hypothetical protein
MKTVRAGGVADFGRRGRRRVAGGSGWMLARSYVLARVALEYRKKKLTITVCLPISKHLTHTGFVFK